MVELLVLGSFALVMLFVVAVLASVLGVVVWVLTLPFKILGWALKGLVLLLALPFMAVFGVVAFFVFGAGLLLFLVPFLPIALLVVAIWWLVRRSRRSAVSVTG